MQRLGKSVWIGARREGEGVAYCVWAPKRGRIEVYIEDDEGNIIRQVRLRSDAFGYFSGTDSEGKEGDLYKYCVDGKGSYPDPASRFQPKGVHGPSMVLDASAFTWNDQQWKRPAFRDLVIYEAHIGAFTKEGTFTAAADRLEYLRDLGVNAVEVMPIADFAGDRNWGYDGVCLFAPARVYGHPDDFRRFVERAHQLGLAVILDVVYNHFGPSGCYLQKFADEYLNPALQTPWGSAINFSESAPVREFYLANIRYWLEDYHIDGFRLDATHAIIDHSELHILAEIAQLIHSYGAYVIAEDERNDNRMVISRINGGLGMDAVWADDFHHALVTILIESSAFTKDFTGSRGDLFRALRDGWLFTGDLFAFDGARRGTECAHLPPASFIYCISNHDQSGNRALGERPHQLIPAANYRAASALLCLCPYVPLLFMGQEWAASTPFQFFTDHEPDLGALIEKGRIEELLQRPVPLPPHRVNEVPNPQAERTFLESKLRWSEREQPGHIETLRLYREVLKLRREHPSLRPIDRAGFRVFQFDSGPLGIQFRDAGGDWLLICELSGGTNASLEGEWTLVLDTNAPRFGGSGRKTFHPESASLQFKEAGLLLLRALQQSEG